MDPKDRAPAKLVNGAVGTRAPEIGAHLDRLSAMHDHICPRQVLGVRIGLLGADLLRLPAPQVGKRMLAIVETDGCAADGVAVATGCWVGRRTMRVEDYGKVAATFVDTETGGAVRVWPHRHSRSRADEIGTGADRWSRMLDAYQRMADSELLESRPVELVEPIADLVSTPGRRSSCAVCGEEVMNGREVVVGEAMLCRACAQGPYYRPI